VRLTGPWPAVRTRLGPRLSGQALYGQGVRFVLAGALVALVYLLGTTLLHLVLGLPFELALAIGFALSLTVHFSLQRLFVWKDLGRSFALSVHHQVGRYLAMAGLQYAFTAITTARLPKLLDEPVEVVFLAAMVTVSVVNFLVFRNRIFHAAPDDRNGCDGQLA
jgi:putative flippase GtrA